MERSINQARNLLAKATTVAAFTGAGLSAESGIDTFRDTSKNALWRRFDPMTMASPEGFAADPENVIAWYNWRRQELAKARPNPGHIAFAQMPHLVQITQNVDDLLERGGVNPKQVLHLHGSLTRDRCHQQCGFVEAVTLASPPARHNCPQCRAAIRPDVVWFGESLPMSAWHKAEVLCSRVNCLLVVGTSASVYPAAGLIDIAKSAGACIIVINPNTSGVSSMADIEIQAPSGEALPVLLQGLSLSSY